ncbi:MAG: GntR family transcriptional regulator [Gammaproteobacteria bacterium]|nr:GntR family transcriptional regulator [Gammaproteobacteria bacterium]
MRKKQPRYKKPDSRKNTAKAQLGECALLETVTVTRTGAFMDCGLERDLLVPVSQQLSPMVEGQSYVVYLFLDPEKQVIGSTKLHKFLDERAKNMAAGEQVDLMIVNESELGFKAIVNGTHLGLLYKGEVFRTLKPGDKTIGYIKSIRPDRKIDLCLQRQNQQSKNDLTDRILAFLEANGGSSELTDYSPPDAIYKQYGVSKGNYKRALGKLYKQRRISLGKDKVTLL